MSAVWTWKFEMYLSGVYVDCTRDVIEQDAPINWDQGIKGAGPGYRTASSGTLTLMLDNSEANSGGKLGYYAPGHTNCRAGFGLLIPVRMSYTHDGDTDYYRYYITSIKPSFGQFGERLTALQAADYIHLLSRMNVNKLDVQTNQRPDQIIATLHAAIATPPQNENLTTEPFTVFTYSLHDLRDEKSKVLGAINKVTQSSGGYYYIDSDTTDGETATYEDRVARYKRTVLAAFDNTLSEMDVEWKDDQVVDQVRVTYNPGRVDTEDVVLASIPSQIVLGAGETRTIELRIVDPNGKSNRVSALSFVDPLEAGTDYKFSSINGNSGTDLNASLGLTVTFGANSVKVVMVNNASVTGYIEAGCLQVRGKAIYLYDTLDVTAGNADAENAVTIDLPYVANYYEAQSRADMWEGRLSASENALQMGAAAFYADYSDAYMEYAKNGKIGQPFTVTEGATGMSTKKYFINYRKFRIEQGMLHVTWLGEPAEIIDYMQLDTTDKLDDTKVLA
jgi:hypothetical protein